MKIKIAGISFNLKRKSVNKRRRELLHQIDVKMNQLGEFPDTYYQESIEELVDLQKAIKKGKYDRLLK